MDIKRQLSNHSPSKYPGNSHAIYETINFNRVLSIYELRESLVSLAQSRYLSIKYINNHFGLNVFDATNELYCGNFLGKQVFVASSNSDISSKDKFWHINPDLSDEELIKYMRPGISKRKNRQSSQ